jgi:alkaline phosphatase D
MKFAKILFYLFFVIILFSCTPDREDKKAYAPSDAYLPGSEHPYYGSTSKWARRVFSSTAPDRQYKTRGQEQLLAILDGEPDKAVALCQEHLTQIPEDAEAFYMLTIAWCQLNETDKAMETMKLALDAGLPFQRFLAGPRDLLEPLTKTPAFMDLKKKYPTALIHGPMLGCMTDQSVRFWVRTLQEVPVRVRVLAADKKGKSQLSGIVTTKAEKDYTEIIEVNDLKPGTVYHYDIIVDGKTVPGSESSLFTTFSVEDTPGNFKIAFGGGAGYTPQYERMWDTIATRRPDALLLLGDNVYIDLPEMPGAFHDYTYYRRQSRPEYRRLIRSTPVFTIWDDHDAGLNDCWLGPYRDKPDWKMPLLDVFRRNWNNPAYGTQEWPGCWYKFTIADVDFFMLDCRFYRTNPFAEDPTMLGPQQKKWLFDELQASDATFKVLVSSVPWAHDSKPGSHDPWDGYPEEREEIFSTIEKQRINGVFLLSADRHRSDVWVIKRIKGYDFYEFESSKLTNMHTHKIMPGALYGYNEKCSFGLLSFNTSIKDPEVNYEIVSIDNEVVHSQKIHKSELESK